MTQVPVINLQSKTAHQELISAFKTIGFVYIENHGVSQALQTDLENVTHEFFALPLEEKMKFHMKLFGRAWRGYFAVGDELTYGKPDQKEGFYFGVDHLPSHPGVMNSLPTFGQNPWPNEQMKKVVTEYMLAMKKLAFQLMTQIAQGLGLRTDFFSAVFSDEPTELFRIFGYPKHDEIGFDEWGVAEHTDYGYLTILKQDQLGGLQAKMLSGEWLEVPPIADTFVLNIGDMLEHWTKGSLRSTPHRVRNKGDHERFSYPYFFDPNWQAKLSDGTTYGDFIWNKISKVFPEL